MTCGIFAFTLLGETGVSCSSLSLSGVGIGLCWPQKTSGGIQKCFSRALLAPSPRPGLSRRAGHRELPVTSGHPSVCPSSSMSSLKHGSSPDPGSSLQASVRDSGQNWASLPPFPAAPVRGGCSSFPLPLAGFCGLRCLCPVCTMLLHF